MAQNPATLLVATILIFAPGHIAHAADGVAPIADDNADYLRICSVFGAGFISIPGTQTCLKTSGYIRYQYNYAGSPAVNTEGDDYQISPTARARLNFDVREPTDLGTLRAFVQLQAQSDGSGNPDGFIMKQAYMQLGGFLAGYTDTLWASETGGIEDGLPTDNSLAVGDVNTNQINYTFSHDGFSLTLGLEDSERGSFSAIPQAKLAYSGTWGAAYLAAVYDESFDADDLAFARFLPGIQTDILSRHGEAVAVKAGLRLDSLLSHDSTIKIDGHWASDPTSYATISGFTTAPGVLPNNPTLKDPRPGAVPLVLEWSIGAGFSQKIDRLTLAAAGRYGKTFDYGFFAPGAAALNYEKGQYWALVGDIGYDLTTNMSVLAEVTYTNVDFTGIAASDQTSGLLRFERSF
ncbi:porin [Aureimonas fodinaquatilis]|uniref:Porin n=1 Tax=Aureimonas fodinaquatilis TaxID=2565783 RepID=A0A5B0DQK2_9HYPH|nr:porin [Aureimonas fodinaquatilis]KAA0969064.1 porin [Aureimonas fodinaquatilis]